ncbi:MAG: GntR family transcriptional regulator, partial [Clostridia bacterium]|nr:GntR family transcriptional regulator [Clostridia bacterium]
MESAVTRIYNDMRQRIMRGDFDANSFFIENGIAEEYKVSRGTAREAMLLLCEDRFLIKHPRKGYFLYRFSEKELSDMRYARYHLELAGIHLVLANCTDEEIRSLYDSLNGDELNYLPEEMDNFRFHTALAALSGNHTLVEFIARLLNCTQRDMAGVKSSISNISHQHIIEAL